MNRLTTKKRAQIVSALVEGNSIRATCRMTGAAKGTVLKLIADLGKACVEYQDRTLRNLTCKRIQCDEIWSFCYAKEKNLPEDFKGWFGFGDVWTWTAIDADTKLALGWLVGERSAPFAQKFMEDLASRLAHWVQLTTDGHKAYCRPLRMRSGVRSTTRCWLSCTAPLRTKGRRGTALPNAAAQFVAP